MSSKLFVGGLSWNTDEGLLGDSFAKFGALSEVKIITDRETGRSRGFGFVTFEDQDAANQAIEAMDGTELDGRRIKVSVAQDRKREGGGGGPRRHGGGGFGGGNRY